jgi:hypothetical protein
MYHRHKLLDLIPEFTVNVKVKLSVFNEEPCHVTHGRSGRVPLTQS